MIPCSYKGFAITARAFQIRGSGQWTSTWWSAATPACGPSAAALPTPRKQHLL